MGCLVLSGVAWASVESFRQQEHPHKRTETKAHVGGGVRVSFPHTISLLRIKAQTVVRLLIKANAAGYDALDSCRRHGDVAIMEDAHGRGASAASHDFKQTKG